MRVRSYFSPWLLLILIIGLAAAIRWRINFGGALMPGVNGPYYPVQVRSLLEDGRLAFPDFPLVFWLEALGARFLFTLRAGTLSDCIMWASKGVGAIFPILAAVPTFLLTQSWITRGARQSWLALVAAAFSVLYPLALITTADFQKSAVGTVWLLSYLYYLYQTLQEGSRRSKILAGVFFLLTGLTHIGCFGIAIVCSLVVAGASLLAEPKRRRVILRESLLLLLLLVMTAGGLYLFFDPARVERLLGVFFLPAELFKNPAILNLLRGQGIFLGSTDLVNLIFVHALAIGGIFLLVRRWATVEAAQRLIVLAAILTTFLLASPLFGQEWAMRLSMIAYIPATVVLAFLLAHLQSRTALGAMTAVTLIPIALSAVMMFGGRGLHPAGISEASYEELQQLRSMITHPEETLVLARHGLEWWAAWVLETDVGQRPEPDPGVWDKYPEILYLEQIAGAAGFGPAGGASGAPFPEVKIPPQAEILFEGRYFRLARATQPPEGWYPGGGETPSAEKLRLVGKIKIADGSFPGIIFANDRFLISYESRRAVFVKVHDQDLAEVGGGEQLTGGEGADHQMVFGDGYFYLVNSFSLRKFDSQWKEIKRVPVFEELPSQIREKWSPEEGLDDMLLYYTDGSVYLGIASGKIPPGDKEKKLDLPDDLYIREYDRDLKLKDEVILEDIGNAPGASLFSQGETFTVVSSDRHWDDSSLIARRYDQDWNFIDQKTISAEPDANEEFPMGVLFESGRYFVGYHYITGELSQPAPGKDTFRTDVVLSMFDSEWNLLGQVKVTGDVPEDKHTLFAGRPHLALVGNKLYVAYDSGESGRPEIFVKEYEIVGD